MVDRKTAPSANAPLSPFGRKRLLVEYRQATRNEIEIDEQATRYAGTSPDRVGYIPRPGLWMGKARVTPLLTRSFALAVATAWRITRGLPFHALKAVSLARHARRVEAMPLPSGHGPIGLALSRRAMEVISAPTLPKAPLVWIVPPWVDAQGLSRGRTLVDATTLLSKPDFWDAFALALSATATMARDRREALWVLQSYTAVPWFCLRIALSRVEGQLFMAEHFDRWAVLADQRAVAARRLARRTRSAPGTTLALVQHGEVTSLSGDATAGSVLPYRLDAVSALHVYDGQAEQIFLGRILTDACARRTTVSHFQPSIVLFEPPASNKVRVLFVGHPICASLHVAILSAYRKRFDIDAFYKPHPAAGSADICNAQDWTMLNNQSGFPRVDMLVAYPSTLVREYAIHNVSAFVHSLSVEEVAQSAVVADAVAYLGRVVEQRRDIDHTE